jgi:acyl dehydratase
MPTWDDVQVGDVLPDVVQQVRRADLVRYAGASGDFNVIHWSERVARAVGLPDVIAQGMLTMAQAVRVVTAWTGDPGAVESYSVRFSRPVVVPDDDAGATLTVSGVVEDKLEGSRVAVLLTATAGGSKVLSAAKVVVRLP